jgi:hypothetical protein
MNYLLDQAGSRPGRRHFAVDLVKGKTGVAAHTRDHNDQTEND